MPFDIEAARDAARGQAERTSFRALAPVLGMSPTGLRKFLDGTRPYGPTRRRLQRWMETRDVAPPEMPAPEVVARALDVLLGGLPEDVQARVRVEMMGCLRRAYGGADDRG